MTKKHPVTKARIERFVQINEAVRQATAFAEGGFFQKYRDLNMAQLSAIRTIDYFDNCTMSQIAKSTGLTLGSVTTMIDRLIERGYVKRERSQMDRRLVFARLTKKGQSVADESNDSVRTSAMSILAKFSAKEQQQFLDFFARILE